MAVLVNQNGTAVAEEQKNTPQPQPSVPEAADTGSDKVSKPGTGAGAGASGGSSIPDAAAAGTGTETPFKGIDYSKFSSEYSGRYDQQLADLYNQITGREAFKYNADEDDMYQQYVQRYQQLGQKSMMDTMGQAAALTGGYGSSYSQNVGQQAYDEYMLGLNDKALEMSQQAYQRYKDEGDALARQYGMLGDMADDDYNKWADAYERAQAEAALRGSSGDFEAYRQMFGDDAAKKMQATWAATVLMPLYANGQMDAEKYKELAGEYPVGYVPPGEGGGGGDSGSSAYISAYNAAVAQGIGADTPQTVDTFFKNFLNSY